MNKCNVAGKYLKGVTKVLMRNVSRAEMSLIQTKLILNVDPDPNSSQLEFKVNARSMLTKMNLIAQAQFRLKPKHKLIIDSGLGQISSQIKILV